MPSDPGKERIAISHFVDSLRDEFSLYGGPPANLCVTGGIWNTLPKDIQGYIRKEYVSPVVRNFLEAHPKIFFISGSGNATTIDVASQIEVYEYLKNILSTPKLVKIQNDNIEIEAQAINYFTCVMQMLWTDSGVVMKTNFGTIYSNAPQYIKNFVQKEYGNLNEFVATHHEIFPETRSGAGVRINPKIQEYIVQLRQTKTSEWESKSTQSESGSNSTYEDCDEKTAILHFANEFRKYHLTWIKHEYLSVFFNRAPKEIIDYLKHVYGERCFAKFLEKHKSIFPKSPCSIFVRVVSADVVSNYITRLPSWSSSSSNSSSSNERGATASNAVNLEDFLAPTLNTKSRNSLLGPPPSIKPTITTNPTFTSSHGIQNAFTYSSGNSHTFAATTFTNTTTSSLLGQPPLNTSVKPTNTTEISSSAFNSAANTFYYKFGNFNANTIAATTLTTTTTSSLLGQPPLNSAVKPTNTPEINSSAFYYKFGNFSANTVVAPPLTNTGSLLVHSPVITPGVGTAQNNAVLTNPMNTLIFTPLATNQVNSCTIGQRLPSYGAFVTSTPSVLQNSSYNHQKQINSISNKSCASSSTNPLTTTKANLQNEKVKTSLTNFSDAPSQPSKSIFTSAWSSNKSSDNASQLRKDKDSFVDGNYEIDDTLLDLYSKLIVATDTETSAKPSVHKNIECQTISSGEVFSLKLFH